MTDKFKQVNQKIKKIKQLDKNTNFDIALTTTNAEFDRVDPVKRIKRVIIFQTDGECDEGVRQWKQLSQQMRKEGTIVSYFRYFR